MTVSTVLNQFITCANTGTESSWKPLCDDLRRPPFTRAAGQRGTGVNADETYKLERSYSIKFDVMVNASAKRVDEVYNSRSGRRLGNVIAFMLSGMEYVHEMICLTFIHRYPVGACYAVDQMILSVLYNRSIAFAGNRQLKINDPRRPHRLPNHGGIDK